MKKMKKLIHCGLLAGVLAALMCFSAAALTSGDWEYQLLGDEAHITDYLGSGGDVVVPSKIGNATVTDIDAAKMFYGATSITYPGTIKDVDFNVAYGWEELRSVSFGEGVESITGSILQELPNLTSVDLPSTLKTIGDWTFYRTGIRQIDLPSGLTSIEDHAFEECALESVDLSRLTSLKLGLNVFSYCKNLRSITLPSNITEIPQSFAQGCTSLTSIDLPASVQTIKSHAFNSCPLKELYLPVNLKSIYPASFRNTQLEEIIVPYGVTDCGSGGKYIYGAFPDNPNLKAVYIPDTVQSMGVAVISDCPDAIIYCGSGSYAESFCKKNSISYQIDNSVNTTINVLYNGKRISFAEYGQNPVLDNGRTLVPLRSIFETMGADVDWDGATRTAIANRGSTSVKITIGQNILYKNGQGVSLDVPAKLINGRTMVPVRAIAEAFNADVDWIGAARIVTVVE